MTAIKTVIVAGAGSNIGPHILTALHAANFEVSVLTRSGSRTNYPDYVTVLSSDWTLESLVSACAGQDAVVSAVGVAGVSAQIPLIDAAEKAGVKRFIPSEFGWAKDRPMLPELVQRLEPKEKVFEHLVEVCEKGKTMSWSALATGPFFDWAFTKVPILSFVVSQQKARIYDSGNASITTSTGTAIAKAISGTLLNPKETENRWLKLRSMKTSQNEILAALEDVTGAKWDTTRISTKDVAEGRKKKIEEKKFMEAFTDLLTIQLFDDGFGGGNIVGSLEESDNALLGVEEESIRDVVAKFVCYDRKCVEEM